MTDLVVDIALVFLFVLVGGVFAASEIALVSLRDSQVRAMADRDPALAEPLVDGLPHLRAEAVYAVRYEMATTLADVLERRVRGLMLSRDATADAAATVAELIAPELGWSDRRRGDEVGDLRARAALQRDAPGLPDSVLPGIGS